MTDGPRVLLTTEGTYPFVVGGVSSWCDLLVKGAEDVRWQVLPIVAPRLGPAAFSLPAHAELTGRIELWSQRERPSRRGAVRSDLPATLVRALLTWGGDALGCLEPLVWCRLHPGGARASFRSREAWHGFTAAIAEVLEERDEGSGPPPRFTELDAAELYQTLYWIARTAEAETPDTDLLMVTAAGWAAVPALVHRALHGTPYMLVEHGVYVREAYLAAARSPSPAAARFRATRLARSLARAAYAEADVIAPVTAANARWETGLGVDEARVRVVENGVRIPEAAPSEAPGTRTVVSVGRIDPLKDVHTMLRVAQAICERMPDAQVLHYGPVTPGQDAYGASCHLHHERLGLGDRFRFMGPTRDPHGAMAGADVVLLTSISEGLPLAVLEGMAQARPIVATAVGGVADVVRGCGLTAPPGDAVGLARATCTLLRDPALAARLGRRGYDRVRRRYRVESCLDGFRTLIGELVPAAA